MEMADNFEKSDFYVIFIKYIHVNILKLSTNKT